MIQFRLVKKKNPFKNQFKTDKDPVNTGFHKKNTHFKVVSEWKKNPFKNQFKADKFPVYTGPNWFSLSLKRDAPKKERTSVTTENNLVLTGFNQKQQQVQTG